MNSLEDRSMTTQKLFIKSIYYFDWELAIYIRQRMMYETKMYNAYS